MTAPSFLAAGTVSTASSFGALAKWPAHTTGQLGVLAVVTDGAGTPAVVSPTSGGEWIFDGVDDRINFGNVLNKLGSDAFTLQGWMICNDVSSSRNIWDKQGLLSPFSGYFLDLPVANPGRLKFCIRGSSPGAEIHVITSSGNLADGLLHHVVATYDGSGAAAGVKLYVDGSAAGMTVVDNSFSGSSTNTAPLYAGFPTSGSFLGQLHNLAMWSRVLTAPEVAAAYNGGTPPVLTALSSAADLQIWVKLNNSDTASANGIVDYSGNGLTGTAEGGLNKTDGGWTAISDTNQTAGIGAAGCRMQLFRRLASSSSQLNTFIPILTNSNISAKIYTFSGVSQTTSPIPVSAGATQASATSATVNFPAVSTLVDECLVVGICANGGNTGSITGTMTNASLTGIAKHDTVNAGTVSYAVLSGTKSSFGSVVAGSSLWTVSSFHVSATLVLAPPIVVVPVDTDSEELDLRPVQDGYSCNVQNSCIELPSAGGPLKKRQDVAYAPHVVQASWQLHRDEYSQFMGFFRTTLNYGEDQFLLDLITDIGTPTRHLCRTIGGLPRLTKQTGEMYYTSCTLEAQQNPTFTGLIEYREPNLIVFFMPTPGPFLEDSFEPGDLIQIIDSKGVHTGSGTTLNLDGVYTVEANISQHAISLVSPTVVNSDWTVLASLGAPGHYGDGGADGEVISTITKVPV